MKRVKLKPKTAEPIETEDDELKTKYLTVVINETWRLQYDGRQFYAQERRVRKDGDKAGQEYFLTHAYISNLDNAIVWLARKQIYLAPVTVDGDGLRAICKTLADIEARAATVCDEMRKQMRDGAPRTPTEKEKVDALIADAIRHDAVDTATNNDENYPRVRVRPKVKPAEYDVGKGGIPDFLEKRVTGRISAADPKTSQVPKADVTRGSHTMKPPHGARVVPQRAGKQK